MKKLLRFAAAVAAALAMAACEEDPATEQDIAFDLAVQEAVEAGEPVTLEISFLDGQYHSTFFEGTIFRVDEESGLLQDSIDGISFSQDGRTIGKTTYVMSDKTGKCTVLASPVNMPGLYRAFVTLSRDNASVKRDADFRVLTPEYAE